MPTAKRSGRSLTIAGIAISLLLFGATGAVATGSGSVATPAILGVPPAVIQGSATVPPERNGRRLVVALVSATTTAVRQSAAKVPATTARKVPVAKASARKTSPRPASKAAHPGRNHVWMPALGIDRSVSFFSCSRATYPGDRVYRWGCAGSNNVYLFGHAGSVFKPLHDAYVQGHLRKGVTLDYADAAGTVSRFAVSWWRVTTPDRGAFAYASQSRPALTLQTCLGAQSQYRLIVRLIRVG